MLHLLFPALLLLIRPESASSTPSISTHQKDYSFGAEPSSSLGSHKSKDKHLSSAKAEGNGAQPVTDHRFASMLRHLLGPARSSFD